MKKVKKVELILVDSKEPSTISKGLAIDNLFYCPNYERYDDNAEVYQKLYALSNDKPKEGDLVLFNNKPCRVISGRDWRIPMGLMIHYDYKHYTLTQEKKIVCTNDDAIVMKQFDDAFIKRYILEQNVGNLITECNYSEL